MYRLKIINYGLINEDKYKNNMDKVICYIMDYLLDNVELNENCIISFNRIKLLINTGYNDQHIINKYHCLIRQIYDYYGHKGNEIFANLFYNLSYIEIKEKLMIGLLSDILISFYDLIVFYEPYNKTNIIEEIEEIINE